MEKSINLTGKTRFDARLSVDQKALFERARLLGGFRSLSDFVIRAATKEAQEIIKEKELIIASKRDSDLFFNTLINPAEPNDALSNAAKRYLDKLN